MTFLFLLGFVSLSALLVFFPFPGGRTPRQLTRTLIAFGLALGVGYSLGVSLDLEWLQVLENKPDWNRAVPVEPDINQWATYIWEAVKFGVLTVGYWVYRFLSDVMPRAAVHDLLLIGFLLIYTLVVFAHGSVAWLVHSISWVFRWVYALVKRQESRPKFLIDPKFQPPTGAWFLKRSLGWALVILLLPLAISPALVDGGPIFKDFFGVLFWIGTWILLLDIYSVLRVGSLSEGQNIKLRGNSVKALPESRFGQLFDYYLSICGSQALYFYDRPGDAHEAGVAPKPTAGEADRLLAGSGYEACAPEVERLLAAYRDDADILLREPLSPLHVLVFAHLIQTERLAGRPVLVICSRRLLKHLEEALRKRLAEIGLPVIHDWSELTPDQLPRRSSVLFCSGENLERVFHPHRGLAEVLDGLNLILSLDSGAMDQVRLRFTFARLDLLLCSRPLQTIFHYEDFSDVESQAKMMRTGEVESIPEYALKPLEKAKERKAIVWKGSASGLRDDLGEKYFGKMKDRVDGALLLTIPAAEQNIPVCVLNPTDLYNEDMMEVLRGRMQTHEFRSRNPSVAASTLQIPADVQRAPYWLRSDEDQVLLLILNEQNFLRYLNAGPYVCMVAVRNYLLRDFMLNELHELESFSQLPDHHRPFSRRPQGSLREIAALLVHALWEGSAVAGDHVPGLTADEVHRYFLDIAPPQLVDNLRRKPIFEILAFLLDNLEQGKSLSGRLRRADEGQVERYFIEGGLQPADLLLPVVGPQGKSPGAEPGRLRRDRHGLTYAVNTHVPVDGKHWEIISVEDDRIRVEPLESQLLEEVHHYVFSRSYLLNTQPSQTVVEQEVPGEHRPTGVSYTLRHLHADVRRTSIGFLRISSASTALRADGRGFSYQVLKRPVVRAFSLQNVLEIRLIPAQGTLSEDGQVSKVAKTLCALLQDAFVSMYPDLWPHLAVLSPNAPRMVPDEPLESGESATDSGMKQGFHHHYYPRLETPWPVEYSAHEICLYIVEDSDTDLGIVRSLASTGTFENAMALVSEYLEWALLVLGPEVGDLHSRQPQAATDDLTGAAASVPDSTDSQTGRIASEMGDELSPEQQELLFQSFGASRLPAFWDYEGTYKLLRRLHDRNSGQTISPGPDYSRTALTLSSVPECHFCNKKLSAASFALEDGYGQRCASCSVDAIDQVEEFKRLFWRVKEYFEATFWMSLPANLEVRFQSGKYFKDAGKAGCYAGVPGSTCRGKTCLTNDGKIQLYVESGMTRSRVVATLLHHFWPTIIARNGGKALQAGQVKLRAEACFYSSYFLRSQDALRFMSDESRKALAQEFEAVQHERDEAGRESSEVFRTLHARMTAREGKRPEGLMSPGLQDEAGAIEQVQSWSKALLEKLPFYPKER